MSQTRLPIAIHLFLSRYRDSSLGSFSHDIPNLLCMFIVLITDALHIKLAVKRTFQWQTCLLKFLPTIHILVWVYTFASHKPKNFFFLENSLRCLHWSSSRLDASLSRLDAINLLLSMNLSWIFLRTFVPSSFLTPANLMLILTLKLIYFSLFSAMTPKSFLLNLLPSSLMNKWAS